MFPMLREKEGGVFFLLWRKISISASCGRGNTVANKIKHMGFQIKLCLQNPSRDHRNHHRHQELITVLSVEDTFDPADHGQTLNVNRNKAVGQMFWQAGAKVATVTREHCCWRSQVWFNSCGRCSATEEKGRQCSGGRSTARSCNLTFCVDSSISGTNEYLWAAAVSMTKCNWQEADLLRSQRVLTKQPFHH